MDDGTGQKYDALTCIFSVIAQIATLVALCNSKEDYLILWWYIPSYCTCAFALVPFVNTHSSTYHKGFFYFLFCVSFLGQFVVTIFFHKEAWCGVNAAVCCICPAICLDASKHKYLLAHLPTKKEPKQEKKTWKENHTIVNSMITTIFGLIKHYSEISLKSKKAKDDIWWPFLLDCFIDLSCYGFCAYIRKKNRRTGVVYPEHVNVANCTISYDQDGKLEVTPRFGKLVKMENTKNRIKVYVWLEPRWDTYKLRSPMARLLMSYRRLLRLNSNYLEQENRISNPVIYLEDSLGSHNSVYEAVSAQNPAWGSSIPGMMLSAKDQLQERQQINEYVQQLQQGMVDMINRTADSPGSNLSTNGVSLDKRKKINDIQVPLPSNKRANCFLPSNRTQILEFEEFFLKEVPWAFGFPMSFFENQQSKVSANYKLLESISVAALQTQVQILERMLQQVSRDLFYLQELIINSPMRVALKLKEQSIDYEVGVGNKAPASAAKSATAPAPAPASEKKPTSEEKEPTPKAEKKEKKTKAKAEKPKQKTKKKRSRSTSSESSSDSDSDSDDDEGARPAKKKKKKEKKAKS